MDQSSQEKAEKLGDEMHRIASCLVNNPQHVRVNVRHGEQTSVVEIFCAKEDLGQLIGKQGRNAQALRTILLAIGSKERIRCVLEIIE